MAEETPKPEDQKVNPESIKDRTLKEDEVFGKDPDAQKKEVEDQGKKAVEKAIVRFSSKDAFPDEDIKDISELSLAEISKMKKEELRDLILKGTSEGGIYHVDFEGNKKVEAKIGLQNIFGEENPLLIVQKNSDEDAFYAERGNDGLYYEPGTNKRVIIKTGYEVRVPVDEDQLAAYKEEASQDRMANLKVAKRNEAIAKRRSVKEEPVMASKEKTTAIDFTDEESGHVYETEEEKLALAKAAKDISKGDNNDTLFASR